MGSARVEAVCKKAAVALARPWSAYSSQSFSMAPCSCVERGRPSIRKTLAANGRVGRGGVKGVEVRWQYVAATTTARAERVGAIWASIVEGVAAYS